MPNENEEIQRLADEERVARERWTVMRWAIREPNVVSYARELWREALAALDQCKSEGCTNDD